MACTRFTRRKTAATPGASNQAPPNPSNTPPSPGECEPTPPRTATSSKTPKIIVGKRSLVFWSISRVAKNNEDRPHRTGVVPPLAGFHRRGDGRGAAQDIVLGE